MNVGMKGAKSCTLECEMLTLREEVKQIKMQASKGKKVDYERCVDLHPMN